MSTVLTKRYGIMTLVLALSVVFSTACSKNANTNTTSGNANAGQTTSGSTSGGTTASSPTAALRGYYEAAMNKDIEKAKRYLSAGTMRLMEEGAKKMGKTLDEAFKEGAAQTPATTMPEFSNEKISGDTATVDMKAQGMTLTMPMVKEGGEWKLAMDKMIQDMRTSMGGGAKEAEEGDDEKEGNEEK
jgi:flagellar hook-associated protein FlgK